MLKMKITLSALTALMEFATPGPGTFYLYSRLPEDDPETVASRMEYAGSEDYACHVSWTVKRSPDTERRMYSAVWIGAGTGEKQ